MNVFSGRTFGELEGSSTSHLLKAAEAVIWPALLDFKTVAAVVFVYDSSDEKKSQSDEASPAKVRTKKAVTVVRSLVVCPLAALAHAAAI